MAAWLWPLLVVAAVLLAVLFRSREPVVAAGD
jgi:hypothetical protein